MQMHRGASHISIPSTCKGRCTYKHKHTDKAAKDNTVYACVYVFVDFNTQAAAGVPKLPFCVHPQMLYVVKNIWLRNDYCEINKLTDTTKSHMFCDGYVLITGCECLMICRWLLGAAWALENYSSLLVMHKYLFACPIVQVF